MKAFVCFALFAVAAAVPLQDAQVVVIPDVPMPEEPVSFPEGPVPIPVEMLRSAQPMPIWRDLPSVPIPERNFRDLPNYKISEVRFIDLPEYIQAVNAEMPANDEEIVPEAVNVVDLFDAEAIPAEMIASDAEETIPDAVNVVDLFDSEVEAVPAEMNEAEIIPEAVNVVDYLEPVNTDILAPELSPSEDAEMRFVKFVESPATFELKNVKVPIDAHDIV